MGARFFGVCFVSGQKGAAMSPSKVLALTMLFVATTFAQTEWKEFTSPEGNFRVVFPETPQQQMGAERNLHQSSATAGAESYGLAYADYPPGTDWEVCPDGRAPSWRAAQRGREHHLLRRK